MQAGLYAKDGWGRSVDLLEAARFFEAAVASGHPQASQPTAPAMCCWRPPAPFPDSIPARLGVRAEGVAALTVRRGLNAGCGASSADAAPAPPRNAANVTVVWLADE